MAKITLEPALTFSGLDNLSIDGFGVSERSDVAAATLAVAASDVDAANTALAREFHVALPPPGRSSASDLITLLWIGPGAYLALAPGADDLEGELVRALGKLAAVADATGGRAVLRVAGLRAAGVLARGAPLDLHRRVFGPGDVATTVCAHIGLTILCVDDAPTYDLIISRSYAGSFAEWLAAAVASEREAPL